LNTVDLPTSAIPSEVAGCLTNVSSDPSFSAEIVFKIERTMPIDVKVS